MSEQPVDLDGSVMQVTVKRDGTVHVWLDRARSGEEVAVMLRDIAFGFENEPRRVG